MSHDFDNGEFISLLERLAAAHHNVSTAYGRLDELATEVEGLTREVIAFKGGITMRSGLLLALTSAEYAARRGAAELRKAQTDIGVATPAG